QFFFRRTGAEGWLLGQSGLYLFWILFERKGLSMTFALPDLPYAHDALAAGGMSKETLEYHHDIHHKAYADNTSKAVSGSEHEGKSLEEIVKATYQKGAVAQSGLFNNASQLWNHNQFWTMM